MKQSEGTQFPKELAKEFGGKWAGLQEFKGIPRDLLKTIELGTHQNLGVGYI